MHGKKEKIKLILDTNWWISAFISKQSRQKVTKIVFNKRFQIHYSKELEEEYYNVIERSKFKKFKNTVNFFKDVETLLNFIEIDKFVRLSRDPKDDYLLSLALSCNADYLITGDDDLLVLEQIGSTQIVTMNDFLNK